MEKGISVEVTQTIYDILLRYHQCPICFEIVRIPCRLMCFPCVRELDQRKKCDYVICLQCLQQYFKLNLQPSDRKTVAKCLICKNNVILSMITKEDESYCVDESMMDNISVDAEMGGIIFKCQCGGFESSNQRLLWYHLIGKDCKICPLSWIECKWCLRRVQYKFLQEHQLQCEKAPVCYWCKKYKFKSDEDGKLHEDICEEKMLPCNFGFEECEGFRRKDVKSHILEHYTETKIKISEEIIACRVGFGVLNSIIEQYVNEGFTIDRDMMAFPEQLVEKYAWEIPESLVDVIIKVLEKRKSKM